MILMLRANMFEDVSKSIKMLGVPEMLQKRSIIILCECISYLLCTHT